VPPLFKISGYATADTQDACERICLYYTPKIIIKRIIFKSLTPIIEYSRRCMYVRREARHGGAIGLNGAFIWKIFFLPPLTTLM